MDDGEAYEGNDTEPGNTRQLFPTRRSTRVYWFVCRHRRITTCVGLRVSRGIARPVMVVRWGGEAYAAAQPATGRREQAVPPALV